jgi:hypothetical protein
MKSAIGMLCLTLCLAAPIPALSQGAPDYTIRISAYFDAGTVAAFARQVKSYADLRAGLEPGLPPLGVTTNADEIIRAERALAHRIRRARARAREGEIFIPQMQTQIRKMLAAEVDSQTLESIRDDNPGRFHFHVNGTYPRDRPVSTMPPNILQMLPLLPEGLEYRFVAGHLILRDMKANIIIDDVPYAITQKP